MEEIFKCIADHFYRRQYQQQMVTGGPYSTGFLLIGPASAESLRSERMKKQREKLYPFYRPTISGASTLTVKRKRAGEGEPDHIS
jgi:hypothetical protein